MYMSDKVPAHINTSPTIKRFAAKHIIVDLLPN
jgi:hypothetical protein